VLVTLKGALEATLTLKVKTLEPLAAIAVELVQVMTLEVELQLQLAELVPPKVKAPSATLKPVGKVSTTVIVPEVAALALETVKVYVPVLPRVKLPVCDLVIVKSANEIFETVGLAAPDTVGSSVKTGVPLLKLIVP